MSLKLMNVLLLYGGRDLCRFFDKSGVPLMRVTSDGELTPVFSPALIRCTGTDNGNTFWWNNVEYECGRMTENERCVRIVNTFTCK